MTINNRSFIQKTCVMLVVLSMLLSNLGPLNIQVAQAKGKGPTPTPTLTGTPTAAPTPAPTSTIPPSGTATDLPTLAPTAAISSSATPTKLPKKLGSASLYRVSPAGATSGGCGSDWSTACDFQYALSLAVAGDQLWVEQGTYAPGTARTATFQLINGVSIYGGFAGTEIELEQRNPGTNTSILSGEIGVADDPSDNSYHVVTSSGTDNSALLDGFSITAGFADGTAPDDNGAGLFNASGSPTLANLVFRANTANTNGGGMYSSGGSPILTNMTFDNNTSNSGSGGGLFNSAGSPALTDVTFNANVAGDSGGGLANDGSSPTLTNVTFTDNTAAYNGGGIANVNSSSLTVQDGIFWGDSDEFYNSASTLTMLDSLVAGGCPAGAACTHVINADPLLGSLANYGGFTPTIRIGAGSPAIDAGGGHSTCATTDQRGMARVGDCDLGAYEYNNVAPVITEGDTSSVSMSGNSTPTAFNLTLHATDANTGDILTWSILTPATHGTATASGTGASKAITYNPAANYLGADSFTVQVSDGDLVDTITVNVTINGTRFASPGGLSSGLCSTWAAACELQYVLASAQTGDEIWVKAGSYYPTTDSDRRTSFVLKNGVGLYGGFAGAESLRSQRDPAANVSILSGEIGDPNSTSDNSYHVVIGSGTDATAVLDGFTITAGNASGTSPASQGGGLYDNNGSPILNNLIFLSNSAPSGGGLYITGGAPSLTHLTFNSNQANSYGGGLLITNSNLTLSDLTFNNNTASGGGGLSITYSTIIMNNVIFNANSASSGGGIYSAYSNLTITNALLNMNTAISSGGGGLYGSEGTISLGQVTFNRNSAYYSGGGMFYSSYNNNNDYLYQKNVTYNANSLLSYGGGGGLYVNVNHRDHSSITNATFINNVAAYGGSISGNSLIADSIFWGENSTIYSSNGSEGMVIYDSIVQGNCPPNSYICTNVISVDPKLGAYGYHGGFTPTIPLLLGSPAIDGGGVASTCAVTDQRGAARVGACDMGAYEYNNVPPVITEGASTAVSMTASGSPLAFDLTLHATDADNPGDELTWSILTPASHGTASASGTGSSSAIGYLPNTDYLGPDSFVVQVADASLATDTITVNVTVRGLRYASPGGLTSGLCSTWETACELRYALTSALTGDEIWAAAGTYKPTDTSTRTLSFALRSGVAVYGGFAGSETLRGQRDPAANVTALSGDIGTSGVLTDNSYHVVTGSGTDATAVLDGFTVTAGNANGSFPNNSGGGMYSAGGSPTLGHLIFSANKASFAGGGLYDNTASSPSLTNVTFSSNTAPNGGGLYNNSASSPSLQSVTFTANTVTSGGAGMFNNSSSPTLVNVTFYNNTATGNGGGMLNNASSPDLTNVTFSSNSAASGGGIYDSNSSAPVIKNTILWGDGSEVYNSSSAPVIKDSIVQSGCPAGAVCTNVLNVDPKLDTFANYGGYTQMLGLLTSSPAINAGGVNSICAAADQRSISRPQGAQCDIGAFESQAFSIPSVLSILRANTNPTSASSLNFTVTFSEPVTGVDTGDFSLTTSGVSGSSVNHVSGSGTTYIVTVNAGSGPGTLRLDLVDHDSILSLNYVPLGGTGTSNGDFSAGESYSIELAPTSTPTATPTASPTATITATPTSSLTPTATKTSTVTMTPSPTATATNTLTPSPTDVYTATPSPTATTTATVTPSPSPTPAGPVILAALTPGAPVYTGQTFDLIIQVQAGSQSVDGASAYLNFDPAVLQVVSVTAGSSLPVTIQNTYDNSLGHVDYAAGSFSAPFPSGSFSLLTVTFRALVVSAGTAIQFNAAMPRNSDATFGGASVLYHTTDSTLVISDTAVLNGQVSLQGHSSAPNARWAIPLTVSLSVPGESSPRYLFTPTTDDSGHFTLSGITPGTYDIRVKGSHTLRNLVTATLAVGNNTVDLGALHEGDANNDNYVTLIDFSILVSSFGKCSGTIGFDARADFNNDGCVTLLDFSLLVTNFGQSGAAGTQTGLSRPVSSGLNTTQNNKNGNVQLSLSPKTANVKIGQVFSVAVQVQSTRGKVDGVQAALSFNPALLRVRKLTAGTALPMILQSRFDNSKGTIDFGAGTLSAFPTGKFTLVTIEFEAFATTNSTALAFNFGLPRDTSATLSGIDVLGKTGNAQIVIKDGTKPGPPPRLGR